MSSQFIALIVAGLLLPAVVGAAQIDVIVVYEWSAFGATTSSLRTAQADAMEDTANDGLIASGLGAHSFNFVYVHTSAISFTSNQQSTNTQVLNAICIDGTNPLQCDSEIMALRNLWSADVVLLVSEYLTASACGVARVALNMAVNISNRNKFFYAAVRRGCIQIGNPLFDFVAGHELGHVMSAEHEPGAAQPLDTNPSLPETYNHPHKSGSLTTMMISGQSACSPACTIGNFYSDPTRNYPGTSTPRGHVQQSDNRRFINTAFPVIARYRPEPVPPVTLLAPTCVFEFVECSNGKRRYLVSWYQNDSQPFPVADADYSVNGGSTWYDLYGGIDACVPIVPSTPWIVRARIRSSWGDSPYCTIQIQSGSCSGGDL